MNRLVYYGVFSSKLAGNNSRIGYSSTSNRFFSQKKYKDAKNLLVDTFVKWKTKKENVGNVYPITQYPVAVYIDLCSSQWRGDLDGVLKILLDALVVGGILLDDGRSYIYLLQIQTRRKDKNPYPNNSIIRVRG